MELPFVLFVFIAFLQFITPIVTPPDEYSVEVYLKMAERQKTFVIDAFQIGYAGVNPSVVRDPIDREKMVAVWRKGRERNSKVAYMWLNKDWNPLKDYATVGKHLRCSWPKLQRLKAHSISSICYRGA